MTEKVIVVADTEGGTFVASVKGGLTQADRATAFVALGVALLTFGIKPCGLLMLCQEAMRAWQEEVQREEERARRN